MENSKAIPQAVKIRGLRKNFGSFEALKDFTLDIEPGELVTFLGPSGCGKSTTLRILAGLLIQDEGSILFGDRQIDSLPANHRNVGLVFQNYALFPHMSVADNIAFGLRMRGWSRAARESRVDELLQLVRLDGLADRKPAELSGGQQQRVAVARALAFNPDLVLLDEPLSNLDAKLREQVRLDLRRIQQSAQQTTVFVTHDQTEALVMSDRIVLMNAGRIEQVGTPSELYERPETEFGARFVGANNLIAATLASNGSKFAAHIADEVALAIDSAAAEIGKPGQNIWCCIRPEDLHILPASDEGTEPRTVLHGKVADKIYQGSSVSIEIDVPSVGTLVAERSAAEVGSIPAGAEVRLQAARTHAVARD